MQICESLTAVVKFPKLCDKLRGDQRRTILVDNAQNGEGISAQGEANKLLQTFVRNSTRQSVVVDFAGLTLKLEIFNFSFKKKLKVAFIPLLLPADLG